MVSVVGISASSRADLDRQLAAMGTNLLTVEPGRTMFGEDASLPLAAPAMVRRIAPVTAVAAVGGVDANVYRNDKIASGETNSLAVQAADPGLPAVVGTHVAQGSWLNAATGRYPAVVLGAAAAQRLGITAPGEAVMIGGRRFTVVGILAPAPLAPEIDASALVGWQAAADYLDGDGHPTTIYTRTRDDAVEAVRDVLARTANPESSTEVQVSRPSDALAAKQATDDTFTALLLGLGAVALLVGGVGVANTMVISVLERRGEIGLRRALGATRGQIRSQFLTESLLLSALGGVGGVALGAAVTAVYGNSQHWPFLVPPWAVAAGIGVTLVVGALAGLYPAVRAARISPTQALGG
jgi:putative ABC transport system permease protein